MSKFSEQFIQSGIQKGIEQSRAETFLEMIDRGYAVEEAQLISKVSKEQAEKLLSENKN